MVVGDLEAGPWLTAKTAPGLGCEQGQPLGRACFLQSRSGPGRHTPRLTGDEPSPQWSSGSGRVYGPSSDLTNPFTIHHLQQLVWLRSVNSPSDRRCLCRFSNKPPGHDPSFSSINTAACGPLQRSSPSGHSNLKNAASARLPPTRFQLLPPCPWKGQRGRGLEGVWLQLPLC